MRHSVNVNIISIMMVINVYVYMFEIYSSFETYQEIKVYYFLWYVLLFLLLDSIFFFSTRTIVKGNYDELLADKSTITRFTNHLYTLLLPGFVLLLVIFHLEPIKSFLLNPQDNSGSLHIILAGLMIARIYKNNWRLESRLYTALRLNRPSH